MTTVWASRHEALVSPDGVAPQVCAPLVVPHGEAVRERGNPVASAGGTCCDAAAQARRLHVLLRAVWCPFRRPSMCRPVHRESLRTAWLTVTPIVPATPCHQSN